MSNFFQKWRRPEVPPRENQSLTENPVVAAGFRHKSAAIQGVAAADEGEIAAAEYQDFCASFFHKPDTLFVPFVEANRITRLQTWLLPATREPEPKAFIRLILEMNRQQIHFWDEAGVTMYLKKRAAHGGGPSPESAACLSLLAQATEKPITYYFPDPASGKVKALEFSQVSQHRSEEESGHAHSCH